MLGGLRLRSKLRRILALLDQERQLLLAGRLPELAELVLVREALVVELADNPADIPRDDRDTRRMLNRIRNGAARNAKLMQAAMEGLRDGQAQLARIDEQQARLGTYDAAGRVTGRANAQSRLERRA